MFSKQKILIRQAAALRASDCESPEMFSLLGYPRCCVKLFLKFNNSDHVGDLIPLIQANTRQATAHSFVVNNAYNTAGRVQAASGAVNFITKIHILPWHPCSYDCAQSLSRGNALFQFIESIAPDLAQRLQRALRGVVLYFDNGHCASFEGAMDGRNRLQYNAMRFSPTLRDYYFLKNLRAGNELRIEDNVVRIRKDGQALGSRVCTTPLLLDFSS